MPWRFINNWYENNNKKNYFSKWLIALDELSYLLAKKNIKIIISTPTPEFPLARYEICKSQNDQWFNILSRKDCYYPLDYFAAENGKYYKIMQNLKFISLKHKNLYLFDALNLMCSEKKCNYSQNGNSLYKDDDHLSRYAIINIITPEMMNFLKKEKILN